MATKAEKEKENKKLYDAAQKIISTWPEWKKAYANSHQSVEIMEEIKTELEKG